MFKLVLIKESRELKKFAKKEYLAKIVRKLWVS
jgi:hypothetical protein